jgi:hypothetical protein
MQTREQQFKRAHGALKKLKEDTDQLTSWMEQRYFWADILKDMRQGLVRVEEATRRRLGADVGVWIEQFNTDAPHRSAGYYPGGTPMPGMPTLMPGEYPPEMGMPGKGMDPEMMAAYRERYGVEMAGPPMAEAPPMPMAEAPPWDPSQQPVPGAEALPGMEGIPGMEGVPAAPARNTNEVATVKLLFRAINLTPVAPAANTELAFAVLRELQASPHADPAETQFEGNLNPDDQTGTFTFGIQFKLKRPLKIY